MLPTAPVTLGTMNFGGRTPEAEARRIVDRALERGVVFFDTANMYEAGESERILGAALGARRNQVGIATKVGLLRRAGRPEGLAPGRVLEAIDESLRRLGTDYVDLYYLHAPDHGTPIARTLDAIQELLERKRILAWGVSNYASWQIVEINALCDARRMARPAVSQVLYNLLIRQLDLEYFAFTRAHPIHNTVYNPLAGGLLARDAKPGDAIPAGSRFATNKLYPGRYWSDSMLAQAERYRAVAASVGLPLLTLAYAWLAGRRDVGSILVGPGTVAHLEAALDGCSVKLDEKVVAEIDALHQAFVGTDVSYAR